MWCRSAYRIVAIALVAGLVPLAACGKKTLDVSVCGRGDMTRLHSALEGGQLRLVLLDGSGGEHGSVLLPTKEARASLDVGDAAAVRIEGLNVQGERVASGTANVDGESACVCFALDEQAIGACKGIACRSASCEFVDETTGAPADTRVLTFGDRAESDVAGVMADTSILESEPTIPNGSSENLIVALGSSSLLRFDLRAIPAHSLVDKAELLLVAHESSAIPISVEKMLQPWDEDTATWTQATPGTAWQAAGGMPPASRTVPLTIFSATNESIVTADVTDVVDTWIQDPSTNFGLKLEANANGTTVFASREGIPVERPQLRITYRIPPAGQTAADWIRAHFSADPSVTQVTGSFTTEQLVQMPALVHDAGACCTEYPIHVHEGPLDPIVGLINVTVRDLVSSDGFGAGILTDFGAGATAYLSNVTVEPNWPRWMMADMEGIFFFGAEAVYGEDVTIKNWNADAALRDESNQSQFVRLTVEGKGNRTLRYAKPGPHYLVDSSLTNTGSAGLGSLLSFHDCSAAVVKVYHSTFNGESTVPSASIDCDIGAGNPTIIYLTVDPRTTGEMHPMFTP